MRFKVDENLPQVVVEVLVEVLVEAGHDALSVFDQAPNGKPDADILRVVVSEARALVTLDLGFGNIAEYPPSSSTGIIVFRLARQGKTSVLAALRSVLPLLEKEQLVRKLWIVEEDRVRIRG